MTAPVSLESLKEPPFLYVGDWRNLPHDVRKKQEQYRFFLKDLISYIQEKIKFDKLNELFIVSSLDPRINLIQDKDFRNDKKNLTSQIHHGGFTDSFFSSILIIKSCLKIQNKKRIMKLKKEGEKLKEKLSQQLGNLIKRSFLFESKIQTNPAYRSSNKVFLVNIY
jgi:hypothetical protein